MVLPGIDIQEWTVVEGSLRAITPVARDDDDGIEAKSNHRGQLDAGHLKRGVAAQNQRPPLRVRQLRADRGRDGESDRRVEGGCVELRHGVDS